MATTIDRQTLSVADEDRVYSGSRYSDVVAAIFANPYQRIWGGAGEPALPVYEVTFTSVFGGLIFGATRQGVPPEVNVLATAFLLFVLILMGLNVVLQRRLAARSLRREEVDEVGETPLAAVRA